MYVFYELRRTENVYMKSEVYEIRGMCFKECQLYIAFRERLSALKGEMLLRQRKHSLVAKIIERCLWEALGGRDMHQIIKMMPMT